MAEQHQPIPPVLNFWGGMGIVFAVILVTSALVYLIWG